MVALAEMRRHLHNALRYALTVAAVDRTIVLRHHMEHHRVVGLVGVVMMPAPIGCAQMNLHIPRPHLATDINLGIEEVGAGIGVEQTGVDDRDFAAIVGNKPCGVPQTVLPHILHQFLNHI